jgi:hypothetical protein
LFRWRQKGAVTGDPTARRDALLGWALHEYLALPTPRPIQLTRCESDPSVEGGGVGKVVQAFRDYALEFGPRFRLLVSDGNYDLYRYVSSDDVYSHLCV